MLYKLDFKKKYQKGGSTGSSEAESFLLQLYGGENPYKNQNMISTSTQDITGATTAYSAPQTQNSNLYSEFKDVNDNSFMDSGFHDGHHHDDFIDSGFTDTNNLSGNVLNNTSEPNMASDEEVDLLLKGKTFDQIFDLQDRMQRAGFNVNRNGYVSEHFRNSLKKYLGNKDFYDNREKVTPFIDHTIGNKYFAKSMNDMWTQPQSFSEYKNDYASNVKNFNAVISDDKKTAKAKEQAKVIGDYRGKFKKSFENSISYNAKDNSFNIGKYKFEFEGTGLYNASQYMKREYDAVFGEDHDTTTILKWLVNRVSKLKNKQK